MPRKSSLAFLKCFSLDCLAARKTSGKGGVNYLLTQSSVLSPQSLKIFSRRLASIIFCLCLLTISSPALAHRVLVFAFAEGDTIHTESTFVGSGPVQKGEVKVLDKKSDKVIVTGSTDEKGKFSFKIPPEAVSERLDLLIVVGASLGHQGEWLLKADSYLPKTIKTAAAAAADASAPRSPSSPAAGISSPKITTVDQQVLEETINKALERQLAPMKEMLADLTVRRRTFPEIVGGLGYIMGIFGVVAYFMSKKQPKS